MDFSGKLVTGDVDKILTNHISLQVERDEREGEEGEIKREKDRERERGGGGGKRGIERKSNHHRVVRAFIYMYLNESDIASNGFTDIEDVGIFIPYQYKPINRLEEIFADEQNQCCYSTA